MKQMILSLAAGLLLGSSAGAEEMVFTSWGGTTQEAQTKSWAAPFEAESGIKVLQDGPTDYGKLIQPINHDLLPNLKYMDPAFLKQEWDPENKYSICKDWAGSTP